MMHYKPNHAHLVLEHKRDIALFLAWHKAIQQDRKATDERLCNCSWPSFTDDHVTSRHPLRHVVHKPFDGDLQAGITIYAMTQKSCMKPPLFGSAAFGLDLLGISLNSSRNGLQSCAQFQVGQCKAVLTQCFTSAKYDIPEDIGASGNNWS